jgi:hypothetical protein
MFNEPPREVLERLPRLYANETVPLDEVVIHQHFFFGGCDWYVAEFDGEDTFFGFVNLNCPQNAEWGYFRLSELRDLRFRVPLCDSHTKATLGHVPIEVEWDEHWEPKRFSEVRWEA